MAGIYNTWPQYLGKRLRVLIGADLVEGVLIGLKPGNFMMAATTELPWMLLTATGIAFIDPDNPSVQVFVREGRLQPPCLPEPHSARIRQLSDLIDQAQALVQRTERMSRRGPK